MKIRAGHLLAASAVLFFCGFALAGETARPASGARAVPAPAGRAVGAVPAAAATALQGGTTEQVRTDLAGQPDFDALSEVNDPLFREGSKELLEQEVKAAGDRAAAPGPALRDAPNSGAGKTAAPARVKPAVRPHPAIKKPAHREPGPADPVKASDIL